MVSAVWGVRWGHSEGQKTLNVKNFVYLRICVKTYSNRTRALESIVRFMLGQQVYFVCIALPFVNAHVELCPIIKRGY